jgi:hypothetical protein
MVTVNARNTEAKFISYYSGTKSSWSSFYNRL